MGWTARSRVHPSIQGNTNGKKHSSLDLFEGMRASDRRGFRRLEIYLNSLFDSPVYRGLLGTGTGISRGSGISRGLSLGRGIKLQKHVFVILNRLFSPDLPHLFFCVVPESKSV